MYSVMGLWRELDRAEVARNHHPLATRHHCVLLHQLLLLLRLPLLLLLRLPMMLLLLAVVEGRVDLLGLLDLGNLAHDLLKLGRALRLLLRQLGDPIFELSRVIGRHLG